LHYLALASETRTRKFLIPLAPASFGTLVGGFGLGGGVDFPNECFFGEAMDDTGAPEFKAAVAEAQA